MTSRATLLLSRSDVVALLDMRECIAAVEDAFRLHALRGGCRRPASSACTSKAGSFHIKAAAAAAAPAVLRRQDERQLPAAIRRAHELPTIQGADGLLFDGANGRPLAVMDSMRDHGAAHGGCDGRRGEVPRAANGETAADLSAAGPGGRAAARRCCACASRERVFAYDRRCGEGGAFRGRARRRNAARR